MGIISVSDIELAYGITIADEDIPRYDSLIDTVTAYINDYTGQHFGSSVTETFRCRADSYGIIEFASLDSVELVEEFDPSAQSYSEVIYHYFDGLNSIYNLCPRGTYRVTVSFGDCVAPQSIIGIATALVGAGGGADTSASGGLVKKQVGDVVETYGVLEGPDGDPVVTLSGIQSIVLGRFNVRDNTTLRP